MKTIICKILVILTILCLALSLCACSVMISSYSATVMTRENSSDHFYMSFGSMTGRVVTKMIHTGDQDGAFLCTASLEEGEIRVYYVTALSDAEQPLFTLKGGESIYGERLGYLTNGEDPHLVVETVGGSAKGAKITVDIVH